MTRYKVGYFVGSLATRSINRRLAKALVQLAPAELEMTEIPFKDLPLYSYDYDADSLKNAIDWASRPYGTNAFARKPSATIGTSPGKIGTAIAQQHLRSILSFCNSPQMNSIEAYIQFERGLIGEDGTVTNAGTEEFLRKYMAEFHGFIQRVYTALPRNP
jgi:chromate reductase